MQKENRNKSFVLRIDAEMMNAIEKWAADEFRSVNGQILYILNQALNKSGRQTTSKNKGTSKNSKIKACDSDKSGVYLK